MKRIAVVVFFLLLAASRSFGAPCVASPTRLCLNAGRFATEVTWKDFQGNTGAGQAISLTGDTGYFWFFTPSNVELVVKVVDGRGLNSAFWVFYGALSNVEYTMTVTDSVTGNVKTYSNPSGTFGSVGDTSAFPLSSRSSAVRSTHVASRSAADVETSAASIQMALREALLTGAIQHPKAARSAATTTCVPTATSLCLNDGRFRVDVDWTDFAGNTGVGTAVPLTADTGYFWFFSSNNVELTVKVLDARVLNGNIWVFYGALSNVQYEMHVTDTLTGVVNTYSNTSGRFASIGDTKGFSSGARVSAQLDPSRAASAVIPAQGGTLSATGADGTVFTLTMPDGAILSDQEITMTPVASVGQLPLGGGLAAAVQLGPEGLLLFKPATLVISPPAPVAADQEATFSFRGNGDEFILFPPDPSGTAAVSLSVVRFASYGVGRGTATEQAAQRARGPATEQDAIDQMLQEPAAAQRAALRTGGTSAQIAGKRTSGGGVKILDAKTPAQELATRELAEDLNTLTRRLPTQCSDDWSTFLSNLGDAQQRILQLTGPDQTLVSATISLYSTVFKLITRCYDEAYGLCRSNNDPSKGSDMLRIYIFLANNSMAGSLDKEKISKCLTFQLKFNSFIQEAVIPNGNGATFAFRHQVEAVVSGIVPYIILLANPGSKTGELNYLIADHTGGPGESKCTMTESSASSVFTVEKLTININVYVGKSVFIDAISMQYEPGHPKFTFNLSCEQSPVITVTQPRWSEIYLLHHAAEADASGIYSARGWTSTDSGDPFAYVTYEPSSVSGIENTALTLKHTPQ